MSVCAKFQLHTKSKSLLSDDLAVGGGGLAVAVDCDYIA